MAISSAAITRKHSGYMSRVYGSFAGKMVSIGDALGSSTRIDISGSGDLVGVSGSGLNRGVSGSGSITGVSGDNR